MHDRVSLVHGRIDLAVFFVLSALAAALYWPVFSLRPLEGDNIYILWWAHSAPISSLLRLDPGIYPEWRPIPFQTIWLEHQLVPLDKVAIHYAVNLLLWTACAWLVYQIIRRLTGARAAGAIGAVMLLVDRRGLYTIIYIVERQTALACGFGLLAILLIVRAANRRLTRGEAVAVSATLLASVLSKEYGLAFVFAAAAFAAIERRSDLAWPAITAAVVYGSARMVITGGVYSAFCEDMGFFFDVYIRCIDPSSTASLPQMAYNVVVTAVGIPLPGVFEEVGMIALDPLRLSIAIVFLAFAVTALVAGPPILRLIALVPVFIAVLSFAIYRERNHMIGVAAFAILASAGFWQHVWRPASIPRAVRVSALAFLVAVLCWRAIQMPLLVTDEVRQRLESDPCKSAIVARPRGIEFAELVKTTYGMDNPSCAQTD
jgi:hypothetical protein